MPMNSKERRKKNLLQQIKWEIPDRTPLMNHFIIYKKTQPGNFINTIFYIKKMFNFILNFILKK